MEEIDAVNKGSFTIQIYAPFTLYALKILLHWKWRGNNSNADKPTFRGVYDSRFMVSVSLVKANQRGNFD